MPSVSNILFFDLEVNPKSGAILEFGILINHQSSRFTTPEKFSKGSASASIICGHNIIAHDLTVLRKAEIAEHLQNLPSIDTLLLSAWLFPKKPKHSLLKTYQLGINSLNDPVEDAKLSKQLLEDAMEAFALLSDALQCTFKRLLQNVPGFNGFFELVNIKKLATQNLQDLVNIALPNVMCGKADISTIAIEHPIELAFSLGVIAAAEERAILPAWVARNYPHALIILNQLRSTCPALGSCGYCKYLSAKHGLKKYFGFDSFRKFPGDGEKALQEIVVEAGLQNKSFVAVFPTGGGKSLTFQLPALMMGAANRSLTVVISPLQSLMKDQVDVLQSRHDLTRAVTINGMLSPLERLEAMDRVQEGLVDLLYISPEALRSKSIIRLLQSRVIQRFVIDEAHSMSTWGHDFRVDYLYIGKFLNKLAEVLHLSAPIPVSCFTATAKPAVVESIVHHFKKTCGLELTTYVTSSKRENLEYHVIPADGPKDKYARLIDLLQSEDGPKIVYVARVKRAEQLAQALQMDGFKSAAYHGQMEREEKINIQNVFMSGDGDIEVIVATTAFGMGVDKDNIKMVVHFNISNSLENYMQESGRAGRNKRITGKCYILFDISDLNGHFTLLNASKLSWKEIYQIWQGIKKERYTEFSKSTIEIAKQAGWDTEMPGLDGRVKNAISILEETGYLLREENNTRVFADSISVDSVMEAQELMIAAEPTYKDDKQKRDADRVIKAIISRVKTKGDNRTDAIAEALAMKRKEVTEIIHLFKEIGVIESDKDLTAYYFSVQGKRNSDNVFDKMSGIETLLFNLIFANESTYKTKISLRIINDKIVEAIRDCTLADIRNVLNYWSKIGLIKKERTDRVNFKYAIQRKVEYAEMVENINDRLVMAAHCLTIFKEKYLPDAESSPIYKDRKLMSFSLVGIIKEIDGKTAVKRTAAFGQHLLLYLHEMRIIELKSGMLIYYNPMKITRLIEDNNKTYTKVDYRLLQEFYQGKAEQIHIVGEYAKLRLKNSLLAMHFVEDYFTMKYDDFLSKYFHRRKTEIRRTITKEKFAEIFGELSEEQMAIVKDDKHEKILVAAGPGSGKTRVLVHKVASLLLLEEVKPDQFLMLTFSKPAAIEFKNRLVKLVGKLAYGVAIFTFHGFAFHLLGRMGNIQRSSDIIRQATDKINNREIPLEEVMAKSVMVVDEYQDVSQVEYDFISAIATLSGKIRVLVAGDDDQNVYEFRGASVKFMRTFEKENNGISKRYFLRRNYRAKYNLLNFTNRFLTQQFSTDRIKNDIELIAHNPNNGSIEIVNYTAKRLEQPLTNHLITKSLKGSTAVLTHTNEEAQLVCNLLKSQDFPAQLISEHDGFSIKNLLEVRLFTDALSNSIEEEFDEINTTKWESAKLLVNVKFRESENLPFLIRIVRTFEELNSKYYLPIWKSFLQESRFEDFFHPDHDPLLVSTMHKSKGKEFDHVFILLNNYSLQTEAQKRVLYVAMTRAKNGLFLHTNSINFDTQNIQGAKKIEDAKEYQKPKTFTLDFTLKDVFLGYYKNGWMTKYALAAAPGNELFHQTNSPKIFKNANQRSIVCLSKAGLEKLNKYLNQGYIIKDAEIRFILFWFDQEVEQEFRIMLPSITFSAVQSA